METLKYKKTSLCQSIEGSDRRDVIEVLPVPPASSPKKNQKIMTPSSTLRCQNVSTKTLLPAIQPLRKKQLEDRAVDVDKCHPSNNAMRMIIGRGFENEIAWEMNVQKR